MSKINTITTIEKTFTVAGVSDLNGVYKARFANATNRIKVLHKNGHIDIRLVELPQPMTKRQAVEHIMFLDEFQDIDAQRAFDDLLNGTVPRSVKPATATVVASVAAAVFTGTELSDIDAALAEELAEFNDADFEEVHA